MGVGVYECVCVCVKRRGGGVTSVICVEMYSFFNTCG